MLVSLITRSTTFAALLFAILSMTATPAAAVIVTVPTGLAPGASYRLAFVSSTTRDALSSNVADYNLHVQSAASAVPALNALGTNWKAIVSTATVDARDNTSTNPTLSVGEPIYRLDDTRIANNYADLWDNSLAAPLSVTELGTISNGLAWTGTNGSGVKDPFNLYLGNPGGVELGAPYMTDGYWIGGGYSITPGDSRSIYAISAVLHVPVPEPIGLSGVVAISFLLKRRRGE